MTTGVETGRYAPTSPKPAYNELGVSNYFEGLLLGEPSDIHITPSGLRSPIHTFLGDVPVYVLQNPKDAYFAWFESSEQGIIRPNATLIDVSSHGAVLQDGAQTRSANSLKVPADLVRSLDDNTFIATAMLHGYFNRTLWAGPRNTDPELRVEHRNKTNIPYTEISAGGYILNGLVKRLTKRSKLVLNINLDYLYDFIKDSGGTVTASDLDRKINDLKAIARQCDLVTIIANTKTVPAEEAMYCIRRFFNLGHSNPSQLDK